MGEILSIEEMPITAKTLAILSSSPTIPKAYQGKPNDMLSVALQGREIGVGPMTAINNMDMIDGTISMRAKLMSALIFAAGHIIKTERQDREACVLRCFRWHIPTKELVEVGTVEFTLEDAEASGDVKKGTYKKYIRAMLSNRAMTLAARTFYGDTLAGVGYTLDEVSIDVEPEDIPAELLIEELDAEVIEEAEVEDEDSDGHPFDEGDLEA